MKMVKMVLLAGISGTLTAISVYAVPLDITWVGGTPFSGGNPELNPGYEWYIPLENFRQVLTINPAGVNSINMTWEAPAGYMYVVNPIPAGFDFSGLAFDAQYGPLQGPGATSLGSVTASSLSVHTVYGTSPLTGGAYLEDGTLIFAASAADGPGTAPFAFTSITISADFSGTGTSQMLQLEGPPGDYPVFTFGASGGGFTFGPTYPDVPFVTLFALDPLPTESTPDESSTLTLAGLGFAGLLLFMRKLLPVNG